MSAVRSTALQWIGLGLLVLVGCGPAADDTLPAGTPVIVISVDTLRSDRLPAYGYQGIETPNLDALAAESVLFERAYSHVPLTLPSHASMFTGLLPPEHGVRNNRGAVVNAEQPTLAERLLAAGYRTGGVVSSMVLRSKTGIAQGFEDYDDEMDAGDEGGISAFAQRRGDRSVAAATDWLDGLAADDPFLLFLHLFDPHTPYDAPDPFGSRYDDPYDAEIAWTDDVLGRLFAELKRLELYDRSLIVLVSDHGEGLGDHGETEHGLLLYREALQVPLLFKLPARAQAGRRIDSPVALVDIAPTVLARLGLDASGMSGYDLLAAEPPPSDRAIYSETLFTAYQYGWAELRSVIRSDLHYIEAPRPELYDLAQDFEEKDDLFHRQEVPEEMLERIAEVGTGLESTAEISREERERLASLGYAGGLSRGNPLLEGLPDPKDHIESAEDLWAQVKTVHATGSLEAVQRVLARMQQLGIHNETLSLSIAGTLMQAGHAEAAIEILDPFAGSEDAETRETLGCIRFVLGDTQAALAEFREAVRLAPGQASAHYNLGALLEQSGADTEAAENYRAALLDEPAMLPAWLRLGHTERRLGNFDAAAEHYAEVLELSPENAEAWLGQAMARVRSGRFDEAVRVLDEAALRLPEQSTFAHALARLLVSAPDDGVRDVNRAMQLLRPLVERQRNTDLGETLAMALAESGQFDQAAGLQREIVASARQAGRGELAQAMGRNLVAYEQGRPWRTPWRENDPIHHPERNALPLPPESGRTF